MNTIKIYTNKQNTPYVPSPTGTRMTINGVEVQEISHIEWKHAVGVDMVPTTRITFEVPRIVVDVIEDDNPPSLILQQEVPEALLNEFRSACCGGNADKTTAELIEFLAERLTEVYGEKNTDYIQAAYERAAMLRRMEGK